MSMMTTAYIRPTNPNAHTCLIDQDLKQALVDIRDVTGIEPEDVLGRCRTQDIAHARQLTYYLLRSKHHSYAQIAKVMNRLDHVTIVYGVQKIKDYSMIEKKTQVKLDALRHRGYSV